MADLRGTSGSVTYAGTEASGGNLIVTDIVGWAGSIELSGPQRVTRPGYLMHRYSFGPIDCRGSLRVVVTDTTGVAMPIPTGVSATLVLLETTGVAYTFKASLFFVRKLRVDSENGTQQFAEYSFLGNATSASDTVVAS